MSRATYATREQVKSALDIAETARTDAQIDRVLQSGADAVDSLLQRSFSPWYGTRYFDWPKRDVSSAWQVRVDRSDLIELVALTSGGEAIDVADTFLEPVNYGPPFDRIELNRGAGVSWASGDTPQRAIAALGWWGWNLDTVPAGTLAGAISSSATTLALATGEAVGIGDQLVIGDEHLLVTGRAWLDTGVNLSAGIADDSAIITLPATGLAVGESVLVDSETMLVVGVAGSNAIVRRAWDGSVLATHLTGADVYASRTLAVRRGIAGTTAASHADLAAATVFNPPSLVRDLNLAEAITALLQQQSGFARSITAGDTVREVTGRGLVDLRKTALSAYGRVRKLAV